MPQRFTQDLGLLRLFYIFADHEERRADSKLRAQLIKSGQPLQIDRVRPSCYPCICRWDGQTMNLPVTGERIEVDRDAANRFRQFYIGHILSLSIAGGGIFHHPSDQGIRVLGKL